MVEHYQYTWDQSMLVSKTVIRLIKLANELAMHIPPTRRELCPAIRELEILNRDYKKAVKTLAFLKMRGRKKQC